MLEINIKKDEKNGGYVASAVGTNIRGPFRHTTKAAAVGALIMHHSDELGIKVSGEPILCRDLQPQPIPTAQPVTVVRLRKSLWQRFIEKVTGHV